MRKRSLIILGCLPLSGLAFAETPEAILHGYAVELGQQPSAAAGFSPLQGERLFNRVQGGEWSCSSCHTQDPKATGRHATTGKPIAPLAPVANHERFTNPGKVEKWFKRNCNDVLGRPCSTQEKGDILSYLLSVR